MTSRRERLIRRTVVNLLREALPEERSEVLGVLIARDLMAFALPGRGDVRQAVDERIGGLLGGEANASLADAIDLTLIGLSLAPAFAGEACATV